jgi:Glycosyltransferase 61
VLPLRESLADFTEPTHRLGRLELLAARLWPASQWGPDVVPAVPGGVPPHWWSDDPTIRCLPLVLNRVPHAFYFPSFGAVISSTGQVFREPVARARYRTPDLTALHRGGARRRSNLVHASGRSSDRRAGGGHDAVGAWWNYGHFVLDCLPGLAAVGELGELADYTPVFPPLRPWQQPHVQLLGLERFLELEPGVYRVEDLLFPSSVQSFLHHPNVNYRTLRARQLANIPDSGPSIPKLHLARKVGSRVFLSDQELRDALEQDGFVTVYTEEHPIEEQIALLNKARVVVGCAALHLQTSSTASPVRRSSRSSRCGWSRPRGSAVSGCATSAHFSVTAGGPTSRRSAGPTKARTRRSPEIDFSFDLDIDDFMGYLEQVAA